MSVILKQRTYRDVDGKAVEHGDVTARYLVGPAGAKVTDQQALELGLKDGAIKKKRKSPTPDKSVKPDQDKELKGEDDKSPDKKTGQESSPEKENVAKDPDKRKAAILKTIGEMVQDEEAKGDDEKSQLFTAKGLPDTYVISTRLQFNVSVIERDQLWKEFQDSKGGEGDE